MRSRSRIDRRGLPWLVAAVLGGTGCLSSAGMYCQEQAECRAGLVCQKPSRVGDGGAPGLSAYGVCVPALLGRGEICLSSDECDDGLRCSNTVGVFTEDERHGLCQSAPSADASAAVPDAATDASTPADAATDGSTRDGAAPDQG